MMGLAAACALLFFALATPTLKLRLEADHLAAVGQIEQVTLEDGSTVVLGPSGALAVDYGPDGRAVRLLAGQAMFDVKPDRTRPFTVSAGGVSATVLGTSFDVRRLGPTTTVAVSRGRVRVAGAAASHDLRAGDWVRIEPGAPDETGVLAPDLVGGWRDRALMAEDRPIASVIDEIRPWYGGRIVLADQTLAAARVTGVYDLDDPATALMMIVRPYGGRVLRITPWLLVVTGA